MKRVSRFFSVLISLLMALTLAASLPVKVYAEDGDGPKDNDIVKYYYDTTNPGLRTGIKKIILSPYTYNDVSKNTPSKLDTNFLHQVAKDYLMKNWAKVADSIFCSQGERANYISDAEYHKKYQKHGTDNNTNADRFDFREKMGAGVEVTDSNWGHSPGYHITGLRAATSMNAIRRAMAQEICNGMNRGVANDSDGPDKILDKSPLGERLSLLKREKKDDETKALYNIATYVNREEGTTGMTYHSYGIAFYDFDLTIIADEKLDYITSAEKYLGEDDPLAAAAKDETTKVKYKTTKGDIGTSYIENNSDREVENAATLTNTDSVSLTTGMETSETYTFSQMVGGELGFGPESCGFPRFSLKFEFTCEEAYSTVRKNEKAVTKSLEQSINTTVQVPAQSAVEIVQQEGTTDISFNYDTPVAISFKVAVFSMGGHVSLSAGPASTLTQGTAGYTQSDYCTIFGGDSDESGYSANENLYNRGVKNKDLSGFDSAYGKTSGRFNNVGGRYSETSGVDWKDVSMTAARLAEIKEVATDVPLAAAGSSIVLKSKEMTSNINHIEPLYLIKKVALGHDEPDEYEMTVGDKLHLDGVSLEALNKNEVPYYGFNQKDGHWVLCDENGNIQESSELASISDPSSQTGKNVVTALKEGTQFVKWVLNDDVCGTRSAVPSKNVPGKYNALKENDWSDNNNIEHPFIKLNITEKAFEGEVKLTGEYTGYVGDKVKLLSDNGLTAVVLDETGKEVSRPLTWESREINGISMTSSGNVLFSKPGTYHVRVYTGNTKRKYSPFVSITALEAKKLDKITISDQANPKTLESFKLGDKDGIINLKALSFEGQDQYGNNWPLNQSDLTWTVTGKDSQGADIPVTLVDGIFTVLKSGTYTITAKNGLVVSNELTLTVEDARKLDKLSIQSKELTENGLGIGDGYVYDLSDVTVTALDQYGDEYDYKKLPNKWVADEKYSSVTASGLKGLVKGEGSLQLECGSGENKVVSDAIRFRVWTKPHANEFYTTTGQNTILEGDPFYVDDLKLTARDQNGDLYKFSDKELASIEWTLTDEGTIKSSTGASYNSSTRILTVKEKSLGYGQEGNVILTGSFTQNNTTVKGRATIDVRQQPILDKLDLSRTKGKADLKTEDVEYCMEYFTVKGTDQYQQEYDLTKKDLVFTSSNNNAFVIKNGTDKNRSTITAGTPKQKAEVFVSSVNGIGVEVKSNVLELTVPRVRYMAGIKIRKAPEMLPIETDEDVKGFDATCLDDEGDPYSEEDLAKYPASISYSLDEKETGATLDTRKNILSTGTLPGEIIISANAVNSSSTIQDPSGQTIETGTRIWIGPKVDSIALSSDDMDANGGKNTVTLEGNWLMKGAPSGIEIRLEDENGSPVDTAVVSGRDEKATADLNVPKNTTDQLRTYKVYYRIGGNVINASSPLQITVRHHDMAKVDAREATCTQDGNIEHWKCNECGKLYADEKGEKMLSKADVTIKAKGHDWGQGEAKAAKASENGIMNYTCKNDPSHKKTALIPVELAKLTSSGASITCTWTKEPLADGYDIFFAKCNRSGKENPPKLIKTISASSGKFKWTRNKLKKGVCYKGSVKAYRLVNGKKEYIAVSYPIHCISGNNNNKYTNPKGIKLKQKELSLEQGKTASVKKLKGLKLVAMKKRRKLVTHEAKYRYATSNSSIAVVSKKGVITAKAKGSCKIYVIAVNGSRKTVSLTVK